MLIVRKIRKICTTCHGNGYIRVATGDTSIDFRNNSKVIQCTTCSSEGETDENGNALHKPIVIDGL
tara:strand:- start:56 stop:253 length:198 start_codon:yes stop_codon:yes gene_type:complete